MGGYTIASQAAMNSDGREPGFLPNICSWSSSVAGSQDASSTVRGALLQQVTPPWSLYTHPYCILSDQAQCNMDIVIDQASIYTSYRIHTSVIWLNRKSAEMASLVSPRKDFLPDAVDNVELVSYRSRKIVEPHISYIVYSIDWSSLHEYSLHYSTVSSKYKTHDVFGQHRYCHYSHSFSRLSSRSIHNERNFVKLLNSSCLLSFIYPISYLVWGQIPLYRSDTRSKLFYKYTLPSLHKSWKCQCHKLS